MGASPLSVARAIFSEAGGSEIKPFDAYGSMALSEPGGKLRTRGHRKICLLDARIVHRIGTVKGGENIVFNRGGCRSTALPHWKPAAG